MSEPPPNGSRIGGLINAARGLTLTNALVIVMIAVVLGPLYIMAFHPEVLDRFLSTYTVLQNSVSSCTYRRGRQKGEPYSYAISTGLAYEGSSIWQIAVVLTHEPTAEELKSYCKALMLIVDKIRERGDVPSTSDVLGDGDGRGRPRNP